MTADLARRQAAAAEREIARGLVRGPLTAIPYAPKDILATKGVLTTNGSKVTATVVPDYESTITDRLAKAGAVLAGKLNLLEFAMGSGVVSGFGPARNPWDLARTPSGSSSGSGSGAGGGDGAAVDRHRHRRLDPRAGQLLRHRRAEADLRPGQPARRDDAGVDASITPGR